MTQPQATQRHVKRLVITGCRVELIFHSEQGAHWSVQGIVECGTEANRRARRFQTDRFDTMEAAEQEALRQTEHLLGHNEDRSTSRTTHWSEDTQPGGRHADDRTIDS